MKQILTLSIFLIILFIPITYAGMFDFITGKVSSSDDCAILTDDIHRDACYMDLALNRDDYSVCSSIVNHVLRKSCCALIQSDPVRDSCYMAYFLGTKDGSVCTELVNDQLEESCLQQTKQEYIPCSTSSVYTEGDLVNLVVDGVEYKVQIRIIMEESQQAKIMVNEELLAPVDTGNSYRMVDGSVLTIDEISPNERGDPTQDHIRLCINGQSGVSEEVRCIDSDGGKDKFKKGEMVAKDRTSYDQCSIKVDERNSEPTLSCDGDNCYVIEMFCTDNVAGASIQYRCEAGCKDGACINQDKESLSKCIKVSTLREGDDKSLGIGNKLFQIQVMVIYDGMQKARMKINGELIEDAEVGVSYDLKDGSVLTIYDIIPNSKGDVTQDFIKFCINGQGIDAGTVICEDSDYGYNYFEKGITKTEAGEYEDYCESQNLIEYYCDDRTGKLLEKSIQCPNGCGEGQCLRVEGDKECKDSDNGLDYSKKGTTLGLSLPGEHMGFHEDYCISDSRVQEGYCNYVAAFDREFRTLKQYDCPNGCKDGACIDAEAGGTCSDITDPAKRDACYMAHYLETGDTSECKYIINDQLRRSCIGELSNCDGCVRENVCLPIGIRTEKIFCDLDKQFKDQKEGDADCSNNFECLSNICIDNKCISQGLWNKIVRWFSNLFG